MSSVPKTIKHGNEEHEVIDISCGEISVRILAISEYAILVIDYYNFEITESSEVIFDHVALSNRELILILEERGDSRVKY
ncbi:hypothetical protein [Alkalihalobacillus trypoxylicola]|uniref:Uncharacterized protein n=1 Tax=Alkalihalobacillus trypoxylicola TaxID=519424 RepID=A0A161QGQ5_9BACI|nr:hypothetical protein [Alkalihalobacillus trypoxylicola]KYG28140.1 hypothetical protein AZF04_09560 [Alkalihalobacillus trypoxylicola]